ncbi:MAG: PfkB family carbohydrate kinase, partial [Verrucomicrobia bacterium]|nr:PfkB family carbohydrate kinase [Verrucomicrobiota bacterium]
MSNPSRVDIVSNAADHLENAGAETQVLVGFDGFVDEIIHVVDRRHDPDHFDRIRTIKDFGDRISAAAGLSANIEMVPAKVKLGGNGPIMANALVAQGYAVHYMGALGAQNIDPVFQEFARGCSSVISLCDPAHTDALEFDDGKLMLGKMSCLAEVNWESLVKRVSEADLKALLERLGMIACTNWTMLPYMNTILDGLSGVLAKSSHRLKVFVDLTDPRKRSPEDIAGVLERMGQMQAVADMVLGLNEGESVQVADVLLGRKISDLRQRASEIREALGLHMVMAHPVSSAGVACAEGAFFIEGPYCPKPKLTTGAGDNFNAGFCVGLLSGLDPQGCLATGVC